MGNKTTVFVIGAGAGVDLNMPLGNELTAKIARALRVTKEAKFGGLKFTGDALIRDALTTQITQVEKHRDMGDYLKACEKIVRAMPLVESIDNFIDLRKDEPKIVRCAKLGPLLHGERRSDSKQQWKALVQSCHLNSQGRPQSDIKGRSRSGLFFAELFLRTSKLPVLYGSKPSNPSVDCD